MVDAVDGQAFGVVAIDGVAGVAGVRIGAAQTGFVETVHRSAVRTEGPRRRGPARASHDYVRHGTSSLYAALDLTTGKVIGALHARHRATEFLAFLKTIDAQVPADLDCHVVLDNASTHKTPAIKRWLLAHHRFVLHFTPTSSSWLNLVERWFAELTTKKLRRGTHTSVRQLNADIRAWINTWNDNPRPYVWTKTADQIVASIGNYCTRINDSRH